MTVTLKSTQKSNAKAKKTHLHKVQTSTRKTSERMKSSGPKISDDGEMSKNTSSIVNYFKDTTKNLIKKTKDSLPSPGQYEM